MSSKKLPEFYEIQDNKRVNQTEIPEVEKFTQQGRNITYHAKGERVTEFVRQIIPKMKQALHRLEYDIKTIEALAVFMQEVQANVLKARGSYILSEKYGSFENIIKEEENALSIIDEVIAANYDKTEIEICWKATVDGVKIEFMNNTPLNKYLEGRINSAFRRNHELDENDLANVTSNHSVLGTKASGIGLGIPMALKMVEDAGGKLYFEKKDGWTSFVFEVPKKF